MSKKKNSKSKKQKTKKTNQDDMHTLFGMHIQKETKHTIIAILLFVLAAFFALSGFKLGGVAGDFVFKSFKGLLGVGYVLLPLTLVLVGISTYKSKRPNVGLTHTISGFLFLLSALGITHVITKGEQAGILGRVAAWPFMKLFDVYIAILVLLAVLVISLVLLFDRRPSISGIKALFAGMFKGKEKELEAYEDEEEYEDEEYEDEEYEEEGEEYEEEEEPEEEPEPEPTPEPEPKIVQGDKSSMTLTTAFRSRGKYKPPPLSLLEKTNSKVVTGDIKTNSNTIKRTLQNFKIAVEMDEVTVGPTVTRYSLKPAQGVRLSRITALQNELRLALAATSIRIEAPIPGKSLVGIEIPNQTKAKVGLRELLSNSEFKNAAKPLTIALGKGVSGKSQYANIAKMPHVLIAGATGAGKSVTVHALVTSLLYRKGPEDLRFIMVDPKRVEMTLYNGIPHLLTPVITQPKKAILALKWAVAEMERRYDVLEGLSVRDIDSYHKVYNKKGGDSEENEMEKMPYIVVIIDELADIMTTYPRELESGIVRLAQMSRAVGIHLVLSTQRPSVNVITGLIKANVPSRIALKVTSQVDSRTILDTSGAEKLLGAGDMLYSGGETSTPRRIQCAFISEDEVKSVVAYLKKRYKDELPDDINLSAGGEDGNFSGNGNIFDSTFDDDDKDELFGEAQRIVITDKKASTSYLQRKLKVGYSRAARLMDELEEAGIIGPSNGSKPRDVLVGSMEELAKQGKIQTGAPEMMTATAILEAEVAERLANEAEDTADDEDYDEIDYEEAPVDSDEDEEDEEEELNGDIADDYEDDEEEDEDENEEEDTEAETEDDELTEEEDYDAHDEY